MGHKNYKDAPWWHRSGLFRSKADEIAARNTCAIQVNSFTDFYSWLRWGRKLRAAQASASRRTSEQPRLCFHLSASKQLHLRRLHPAFRSFDAVRSRLKKRFSGKLSYNTAARPATFELLERYVCRYSP